MPYDMDAMTLEQTVVIVTATLGIPIRVYDGSNWSPALPPLNIYLLTRFGIDSQSLRRAERTRRVRKWARAIGTP
jgi:hypothetical protein